MKLNEKPLIGKLRSNPSLEEDVLIFRNEINQELLIGTDQRIAIIREIPDLDVLANLEGINFYVEWENLLSEMTRLWQDDSDNGFPLYFKAPRIVIDRLAFYSDFVAYFFLYNGSEVDNDYLKNVDDFFKVYKLDRAETRSLELLKRAYKQ